MNFPKWIPQLPLKQLDNDAGQLQLLAVSFARQTVPCVESVLSSYRGVMENILNYAEKRAIGSENYGATRKALQALNSLPAYREWCGNSNARRTMFRANSFQSSTKRRSGISCYFQPNWKVLFSATRDGTKWNVIKSVFEENFEEGTTEMNWTELHEQLETINETKLGWDEESPFVEISPEFIESVHALLCSLEKINNKPSNLHYCSLEDGIALDFNSSELDLFSHEHWWICPDNIFKADIHVESMFDKLLFGTANWDLDGSLEVVWLPQNPIPKKNAIWNHKGEKSSPGIIAAKFVESFPKSHCDIIRVEGSYQTEYLSMRLGHYRGKIHMKSGSVFDLFGLRDETWVVYLAGA